MEKYFKRKATDQLSPPLRTDALNHGTAKRQCGEINLADLPSDPRLRTRILDYNPTVQDQVRKAYLQRGPCQPKKHNFPQMNFRNTIRRFNPTWFDEYASWLEYSIEKDAAYCLYCYLFKPNNGEQAGGDSFVGEGFKNWKKKEKLKIHVGGTYSAHNHARRMCQALLNHRQHVETFFFKQSHQDRSDYRIQLNASIDCIRYLLRQGMAFRGHDESDDSNNKGNFLELLHWYSNRNEEVKKVVLKNAPANLKLTSPDIQKDIVNAAAIETLNKIIGDVGNSLFSILIDISRKEQMAIVLRYVCKGHVIERFVGVEHVNDTTTLSLKKAIDDFFLRNKLSISRLRGQGYDGASNMRGEFNGLKTHILKENESAYYVHCFAHQLQLVLVSVAKNHIKIDDLFTLVSNLVNVVGGSSKRRDFLQEKQASKVIEALDSGEISSGRGLNQEITVKRAGETTWSSHYGTLISIINLFPSIIELLEELKVNASKIDQKHEATKLLDWLESFDFAFSLHLMKNLLGITHQLSQALQRRDQDIVNAMNLVTLSRSRRRAPKFTNLHYYQVDLFYDVIDMQLQELNSRFTETNTELLLCMACLSPLDSFSAFNKQKLIRLAQFYPKDFSENDILALEDELETYIFDMKSSSVFSGLKGISDLGEKLVETKKDRVYPLVLLARDTGTNPTCCDCLCGKSIFCYEYIEK
ncbi:zinc finger MYM-type protein 1-like [Prunus avium]|uniref:Zinc finger MYM-type protein 1-like n=1 Tax=Prunus avium TaxID=42229 RepID=A0A6P5TRV9_PRUAV|nr:zinc finger MYM-type protein 1-like [Prunus avium]